MRVRTYDSKRRQEADAVQQGSSIHGCPGARRLPASPYPGYTRLLIEDTMGRVIHLPILTSSVFVL